MRVAVSALRKLLGRLGHAVLAAIRPRSGGAPDGSLVEGQALAEERFRTPADQVVNYAIFMIDRQGRNATWNRGVQRMLGYSMAEFLGSSVAELFTPEDRGAGIPERELSESIEQGRVNSERWLVRKDGTRLWASVSTTPARDGKGQVAGFARTLRDLTEEKRIQEELERSRAALDFALEAAGLGTWDHDLVTGDMRWDARAKALFGLEPGARVDATTWTAALHPEDLGPVEAARAQALESRKPFAAEYRVVWPDRSHHAIGMVGRGTIDQATGKPLRMAGVMLDITERKRTEQRLQEVLRLEAIGRLAGGIAHDLNNMLVAILGFGDLLADSLQR